MHAKYKDISIQTELEARYMGKMLYIYYSMNEQGDFPLVLYAFVVRESYTSRVHFQVNNYFYCVYHNDPGRRLKKQQKSGPLGLESTSKCQVPPGYTHLSQKSHL